MYFKVFQNSKILKRDLKVNEVSYRVTKKSYHCIKPQKEKDKSMVKIAWDCCLIRI